MVWYRNLTVELPLLLIFTSFLLLGSVLTNLMIYRTCYVVLGYNESDCALLGRVINNETQELEKKVQPVSNVITLTMELPLNIIPVIICIFAGPWSDIHGRKPVQLFSLIGLAATFLILAIMNCFPNISPWYFVFAAIPAMFTGSIPTYFTVVLAYMNDNSTEETRALRMGIFEVVMTLGYLIGSLSSAPLLYATSYSIVFLLAAGLQILAILYTMFLLPESVNTNKYKDGQNKAIQCSYLMEMLKVVAKKRVNFDRIIIITLFVALCVINFITNGQNVVKFQFLREKLGWTLEQYNYLICFSHVVTITGTMGGILLLVNVLKLKETVISFMGLFFTVGSCFLWGIATNDSYIYAGSVVGLFSSTAPALIRTRLAQIVPAEEMGKIFSLIIGAGGLLSVGATYLYTMVYNATIEIHSGMFNFLSGILNLFAIFLVGVVIIIEFCSPNEGNKTLIADSREVSECPTI